MYSHCFNPSLDNYFIFANPYLGSSACPGGLSSFTIEGWYKPIALDGSEILFCASNTNENSVIEVGLTGGGKFYTRYIDSTASPSQNITFCGTGTRTTGNWYHFAIEKCSGASSVAFFDNGCRVTCFPDLASRCFCLNNFMVANRVQNSVGNTGAAFYGYISYLRVSPDNIVYPVTCTNITVPVTPLTTSGYINCNQGITKSYIFLSGSGRPPNDINSSTSRAVEACSPWESTKVCGGYYVSTGNQSKFTGFCATYSGSGQNTTYVYNPDLNYKFETYQSSDVTGNYCIDYFVGQTGLSYNSGKAYCSGVILSTEYYYLSLPNSLSGINSYAQIKANGAYGCYTGSLTYCANGTFLSSGSFSDITGNFCCNYYLTGNTGYYSTKYYCSGVFSCSGDANIGLPNGTCPKGGYYNEYFDGVGSFYQVLYWCSSGTLLGTGECCYLSLPNNLSGINSFVIFNSNGIGSYYCSLNYCANGTFLNSYLTGDVTGSCAINYYLTGNTGYYSTQNYLNGTLLRTECYYLNLPNNLSGVNSYAGIYSDGCTGYSTGAIQYCNNGTFLSSYSSGDITGCFYQNYYLTGNTNYYSTKYYCSGVLFCSGDLNVKFLDDVSCKNGCYYIYFDGTGSFYSGLSYCSSGYLLRHLDLQNITGDYCLNFYSNGNTGYYVSPIIYFSGTQFSCTNCYVSIQTNEYKIGFNCIYANGDLTCSNVNSFCCSGYFLDCFTILKSGYNLGYCSYYSNGTGSYYSQPTYSGSGLLLDQNNFSGSILTGCYCFGTLCKITDGTGSYFNKYTYTSGNYKYTQTGIFTGSVFGIVCVGDTNYYADGSGFYYNSNQYIPSGCLVFSTGICIYVDPDYVQIGISGIYSNGSGCVYQQISYCESGCIVKNYVYTDIISDGTGYYYSRHADGYFSNGYYLSGQLTGASGIYCTIDTAQWSLFTGVGGNIFPLEYPTPVTGIFCNSLWKTFNNGYASIADGPYSNGYFISGYLTGSNCACHFIAKDDSSTYVYDLQNGSILHNGQIYSGLVFKSCLLLTTYFTECCTGFQNGTYDLLADGLGCSFSGNYSYCCSGYEFSRNNNTYIYSDGFGYFYKIIDAAAYEAKTSFVNIAWDFDEVTKNKYFCNIYSTGDICLSFCKNNKLFYEVSSNISGSGSGNLYFEEALCCYPILSENKNPFIYIKNTGINNIIINSSFNNNSLVCYDQLKVLGCTNFSNSSYILKYNEGIVLYLESSTDGFCYITNGYYPFGFFYKFDNVEIINPSGSYPACCFNYTGTILPTYIYEDLCNYDRSFGDLFGIKRNQIRSFNFSGIVDKCVDLYVTFNKFINLYENECCRQTVFNNFCSLFGNNFIQTDLLINYISIYDCENLVCCVIDFENFSLCKNVSEDININLLFNFDFCQKKYKAYNYNYLNINTAESQHCITQYSCMSYQGVCDYIVCDSMNCSITISDDYYLTSKISLFGENAISKLIIDKYNRDDLYLPSKADFDYNYEYNLFDSNYGIDCAQSGYWAEQYPFFICKKINCIEIVNYNDAGSLIKKPILRNICFNYSQNKTNTCLSTFKTKESKSDPYSLYLDGNQKSFFYCGLEYKYYPVLCISYFECQYPISNTTIPITIQADNKCIFIDFPIQALSCDKLKLISNYSLSEKVKDLNINLCYNNFEFNLNCCCSNIVNIKSPMLILQTGDICENPCLTAVSKNEFVLEKNIDFYINPFSCFVNDASYELNSLLLFIASELNSGIVCDYLSTAPYASGYICLYEKNFIKEYDSPFHFSGSTYLTSGLNNQYQVCQNCYPPYSIVSGKEVCFVGCSIDKIPYSTFNLSGNVYSYKFGCTGLFESYIFCNNYWILNTYDCADNLDFSGFNSFINNLKTNLNYICSGKNLGSLCENDISLLKIEIEDEFYTKYQSIASGSTYKIPTSNWNLIYEYKYCCLYDYNNLIPYKLSGNNYNYIIPINNEIRYCDTILTQDISGLHLNNSTDNSCFTVTGNLNFKTCTISYCGGGFEVTSGITGYFCNDLFTSFQSYGNSCSRLFIENKSFDAFNPCSTRIFDISKNYIYSGVQPFTIVSNYPLVNISYPIICNNLSLFCSCIYDEAISGVYYYIYGFNNTGNLKIKSTSPDLTFFNYIAWTDQDAKEKIISSTCDSRENGIIKNNISQINLNVNTLIGDNAYTYSSLNNKYICFNIGGLL